MSDQVLNDALILRFGKSWRNSLHVPILSKNVIPAPEPGSRKRHAKPKRFCPAVSLHRFTSSVATLVSDQVLNDVLLVVRHKEKSSHWTGIPYRFSLAPILKSPGSAWGIHRAFSERRLWHNLSERASCTARRSVRAVGILGRDGSVRFDFKGVFCFSFDPAKEK